MKYYRDYKNKAILKKGFLIIYKIKKRKICKLYQINYDSKHLSLFIHHHKKNPPTFVLILCYFYFNIKIAIG